LPDGLLLAKALLRIEALPSDDVDTHEFLFIVPTDTLTGKADAFVGEDIRRSDHWPM
jgi:hypothetical protein